MTIKRKNPAAVAMGRLKSPAKAAASRTNGAKGGRPAHRWAVIYARTPEGRRVWFAFDRDTARRVSCDSYAAARALVQARNSSTRPQEA